MCNTYVQVEDIHSDESPPFRLMSQLMVQCVSHPPLHQSVTKSLQSCRALQTLMSRLQVHCSPVLVDTEGVQCLTEMALATLGEQDSEEDDGGYYGCAQTVGGEHHQVCSAPVTSHVTSHSQSFYMTKSVNEVICHGIPDMRPLENGDI